MFNVVLLEPEIPQNTGNIGRTCVASGCRLHLIEPMKFRINEKEVKRAGLDYWPRLDYMVHGSYTDFMDYYNRATSEEPTGCGISGNLKSCGADDNPAGHNAGKGLIKKKRPPRIFMATTKAERTYADVSYMPGDYIMFGKESAGIPEEILVSHQRDCVRIPMSGDIRSLNLSNSVAIILYEALRQNGFLEMNKKGKLHRLKWG